VESPLAACRAAPEGAACAEAVKRLKNPYWLGDQPALTQASDWLGAWTSAPSTFAVAALAAVTRKYDPTGLFLAHHAVGSDETPRASRGWPKTAPE
jgi:hypothetical protein